MRLIKEIVCEALDNALEGGYDQSRMPVDEVCQELLSYCGDLEDLEVEDIRDHVTAWQARRTQ